MGKSLVIVESPAKAKTIKKYLGKDFDVQASFGHIVDLPRSKLGVDVEHDFEPKYAVISDKKKYLAQLKKAAKGVDNVYLASDPDREGEAIAWHVVNELNINDKAHRVLFHEITEKAVKEAIEHPLRLSRDKFEAQQARRILDRLVGYQVSPLLWKKVRKGLSAGRVQSVALRLVVDREREIEAFNPVEYWSVETLLEKSAGESYAPFEAHLAKYEGKRVELKNKDDADRILSSLDGAAYRVVSVERKEMSRKALPPFITSTLQREASTKLNFPVKKTMALAQKLYEGMELGDEGPVGLITYMRTDSFRVSEHAITEVRDFILSNFGERYLPKKPNLYKTKKGAQDAHEAIRPTSLSFGPESVKKFLSKDEFMLYKLIWARFLASQMTPVIYDQTAVNIGAGKCVFRATGSVVKFDGFTAAYMESKEEEDEAKDKAGSGELPPLVKDEELKLIKLEANQHFTQPPPRFTESSLVKELEDKGIGRPSTYATILSTIQDREYVVREKRRFKPTLLGSSVSDLLLQGFPEVMDVKFTADMEENLDRIEEGEVNWVDILKSFYGGFSKRLENAEAAMTSLRREGVKTDISCDLCDSPMIIKWGKKGAFLSCSKYPECKNAKRFKYGADGKIEIVEKKEQRVFEDVLCDQCGKPMALRSSRYGKFFGCTGYPQCKGIRNLKDVEKELNRSIEEEEEAAHKAAASP